MFYAFLGALAAQLPLLLAYVIGIVLALNNYRKLPRADQANMQP